MTTRTALGELRVLSTCKSLSKGLFLKLLNSDKKVIYKLQLNDMKNGIIDEMLKY